MSSMVIYMDGSSKKHSSGKHRFNLAWGIVAHYEDQTLERHGCHGRAPFHVNNLHEEIAFVESVRLAVALGVPPSKASFVTDDQGVCSANFLYVKHGTMEFSKTLVDKINIVCKNFYDKTTAEHCLEFIKQSRFTKVKGHERTVYNLRCDDLARHARNWEEGDLTPLLPFEEWLHDGFEFYDNKNQKQMWYPPFSDMDLAL